MGSSYLFVLLLSVSALGSTLATSKPNIIFIIIDDMGYSDIGFRNNRSITPHLDELANNGVILDRSYVQPTCSPSRAAILTGVYPFKQGMSSVINVDERWCIPLSYDLMPKILKDNTYKTHHVGKWHIGFCHQDCMPENRGFESNYGPLYQGSKYTHEAGNRHDFHDGNAPDHLSDDIHTSELYRIRMQKIIDEHNTTDPLFAYMAFQNMHTPVDTPDNYTDRYGTTITNRDILEYLGMATQVDDVVGSIVDALKIKGIFNNTIIVVTSDNGGSKYHGANNQPFRGNKNTFYEGGIRAVTFVHSPDYLASHVVGTTHSGLFHATDWLPTLMGAANIPQGTYDFDGKNQWDMITTGAPSSRTIIIMDISGRKEIAVSALYKYMKGDPGDMEMFKPPYDTAGDINANDTDTPSTGKLQFLFDISDISDGLFPGEHYMDDNLWRGNATERAARNAMRDHIALYTARTRVNMPTMPKPARRDSWGPGDCSDADKANFS